MCRICERQNHEAQRVSDAKHLDFGVTKAQIRNTRELTSLRRICERQNHEAQHVPDAKHLDFGVTKAQIRNTGT